MNLLLPVLAVSYLLGSIPFGYLLVRFFRKADIRAQGSGNIGATNVARAGGKGLGMLTLLLDLGKGLIAVLIARHLAPGRPGFPSDLAVGSAVAAVLGHIFPVWLGFRGGKGVATALGVFLALAPSVALAGVGVFALLVLTTRIVGLASVIAAALFPIFALLLLPDRSTVFLGGIALIAMLVIVKHRGNMARLLKGTEPRFGKENGSLGPDPASKRKARA